MRRLLLKVTLAGIWITFFEFLRNEILFKHLWTDHYQNLGLTFQTKPVNGMLWFVWSMGLAYIIYQLSQKFSFRQTLLISWIATFAMMWIVCYNLQVLPIALVLMAIPMSLLEIVVAELIIRTL